MDDIRIEDDPRKQSAKKISRNQNNKKSRGFLGFMFDLVVKSLLLFIILAIDFTLFANAGSYSVFTSYGSVNMEATLVYGGIAAISFVLVFLSMLILPLDNILLAAVVAVTGVTIINQFAVFDKNSLLLILFDDVFSEDVNVILYKYSHWIIGGFLFIVFYIIFKLLRRSLMMFFTIAMGCLLAWVLSFSYLDSYRPFFRQIAVNPSRVDGDLGRNLVFLSFSNLTPPSNFISAQNKDKLSSGFKTFNYNHLGFLTENNFTVYPNAFMSKEGSAFDNLREIFNPNDEKGQNNSSVVVTDKYFNFDAIQSDKQYIDRSSLLEMLKKQGYEFNVYQNSDIDICNLDDGKLINSCNEKVNYPFMLSTDKGSLIERSMLLFSQWLVSTKFIDCVNPVLSVVRYLVDGITPYSFHVNKLNSVNSFKVLDMILGDMERKNGDQAYFAQIDLPADSLVYDQYCELKEVSKWLSVENIPMVSKTVNMRQEAYYDQANCLYGYLNKFMSQLKNSGMIDNTTVIIAGLNVPTPLVTSLAENDFYRKLQMSRQVVMAIKPAKSDKYNFDYGICTVKDILASYFFNKKKCKDLSFIKTTDKNIEQMKNKARSEKFSDVEISNARKMFNSWFVGWSKANRYNPEKETVSAKPVLDNNVVLEEVPVNVKIEDEPEIKQPSIAVVAEESANTNSDNVTNTTSEEIEQDRNLSADVAEVKTEAQEVIPNTLFDNGVEDNNPTNSEAEDNSEVINNSSETENHSSAEITAKDNVDNPKHGYDLSKVINEAKQRALKEEEDKVAAANQTVTEEIVETKKAVAEKVKTTAKQIKSTAEKVQNKQDEAIRNVLIAPKSPNGKQLSPEELKKQYHEMLRQIGAMSGKTVNVEVVK